MGIEKLWQKSRADRLRDPDVLMGIAEEQRKMKESIGRLGDQTKETCAAILYNTLVRPMVSIKKGGKKEFAPAQQIIDGSVDSTAKTLALVGRVLLASGRAVKYGVRRAIAL